MDNRRAWLHEQRRDMGHTQDTFAELLGVSVWSVRNWEQGRRAIPKWVEVAIDRMRSNRKLHIQLTKVRSRRRV